MVRLLAIDLGAESGRAVLGTFSGSRLDIEEVHRFPNIPVRLGGTLHWDFLRIYGDILTGIVKASRQNVTSVGVDSWGVDFGLLDARGRLIGNPVHYRDERTRGMIEAATSRVPRERIYATTGIQFLPINTLYQLLAVAKDEDLQPADKLLLIPDLIHHFLCGSAVAEYTNASTTQCLDARSRAWASNLLNELNIPTRILPPIVEPGTRLGALREDIAAGVTVIAPATHDTASAVAATPLKPGTAFLSSGTWSLIGLEVKQPILSEAAQRANLTNEGGVAGTIRVLKNVMGLWLIQEARRAFDRRGSTHTYEELTAMAAAARPFTAFVDPDDESFLRPGDLPEAVAAFCARTSQPAPSNPATMVRVLLESLALTYAAVIRRLESVTAKTVESVHIVGGGSRNALLCQLTADATGLPVIAGPSEATAIGNLLVQAIALGELGSLAQGRALVETSFEMQHYEPAADWTQARQRFNTVLRSSAPEGGQQ